MVDKKSTTPHWSDPKDFGLPYVSLEPLASLEETSPVIEEVPLVIPEEVVADEPLKAKVLAAKKAPQIQKKEPQKTEAPSVEKIAVPSPPKIQEEKKSTSWVWVVAVITIALLGFIIWQNQNEIVSEDMPVVAVSPDVSSTVDETPEPIEENSSITSIESETEGIQSSESESVTDNSETTPISIVESKETGTTIDPTSAGELIRIETKPDRAQYFIVVGSLPNERLALVESEKYWDRVKDLYLILPEGDTKNHRLAIGQYSNFTAANNELQRVKDQYTEALWILKY